MALRVRPRLIVLFFFVVDVRERVDRKTRERMRHVCVFFFAVFRDISNFCVMESLTVRMFLVVFEFKSVVLLFFAILSQFLFLSL